MKGGFGGAEASKEESAGGGCGDNKYACMRNTLFAAIPDICVCT